jgi:hypothetical protein
MNTTMSAVVRNNLLSALYYLIHTHTHTHTHKQVHLFRDVLNAENQVRFVAVVMCAAEQEFQVVGV